LNDFVRITVVTIFPEFFESPLRLGVVGRAIEAGIVSVDTADPRAHGKGVHRQVDDSPFGGGPGMVMMVEPLAATLEPLATSHRVFLTPSGAPLRQTHLDRWAEIDHLTLVCGRYEGIDQRVIDHFIDEEVSLGDFVLAGGETAALAVIEGVSRLVPGVVGNAGSTVTESFRGGLLEEPVYTRPAEFRGWKVPEILLSGDHARIESWRREQRLSRTRERRPDLAALLDGPMDGPPSPS
jgi:tRNA (guanine37-N1)-methyltransferase